MKTITQPAQPSPCLASPLACAQPHSWQRVVDVMGQAGSTKRLMDLGLAPGARVWLASVSATGVVLHLGGNLRLAVDAAQAGLVWVEPIAA